PQAHQGDNPENKRYQDVTPEILASPPASADQFAQRSALAADAHDNICDHQPLKNRRCPIENDEGGARVGPQLCRCDDSQPGPGGNNGQQTDGVDSARDRLNWTCVW